ncbi:hypothetical protein DERF_009704 [Dermatophagoides farinae]|uniref:Uncharacterized protein n=1 Tax=Dermatophagoides farinae TaxID=6954 RepID=A0A922HUK3_DERFA|nr:hypothetical protein DERF_009704 [Dermatophagoides farinae]
MSIVGAKSLFISCHQQTLMMRSIFMTMAKKPLNQMKPLCNTSSSTSSSSLHPWRYYHHQQQINGQRNKNSDFQSISNNVLIMNGDEKQTILSTKSPDDDSNSPSKNDSNIDPTKATEEQLLLLSGRLSDHLPQFFQKPHEFRLYNRNIIFEDNIRNVRTEGINGYAWQIAKIKMGAHLKYGKVAFNVLKLTKHVEDSTIKIRWRIVSYPGNRIVLAFWKFKLWNAKESLEKYKDEWIDGFSILYVGGDGLIYRHVCDKVMPDTDEIESNKTTKGLAAKLGVA